MSVKVVKFLDGKYGVRDGSEYLSKLNLRFWSKRCTFTEFDTEEQARDCLNAYLEAVRQANDTGTPVDPSILERFIKWLKS